MAKLGEIFHGPVAMALHGLQTAPFWLALAGGGVVVLHVHGQFRFARRHQARVQPLYRLLENKYYLDWISENILPRARACWVLVLEGRRSGHHRRSGGERLVEAGRRYFCGVVRWVQSGLSSTTPW